MSEFEAVIGLEIHAQVSTKTKMFCGCDNDSFGKKANSNICPICMGFPGVLPVPNKEAIEKGIKAALALKCKIPKHSKFDRKNYFYPDLPYGYQISQFDEPVSKKGEVEIIIDGKKKKIGITRLHLENDAGKLTHTANGTLLDFNRAGTPLMEIVSEPDMSSAKEAREYAQTIQKILRYAGGSDCDMEKGMMRFDASVSIRKKGEKKLNPRAEIKNLNSFRSLEAAINFEIERQSKLTNEATPLGAEETVAWDELKQETKILRKKETAADYRYFPEPDIPPIEITEEILEAWREEVAELPMEKYERFMKEFGLSEAEALILTENGSLANYFEYVAKETNNSKTASSLIITVFISKFPVAKWGTEDPPIKKDLFVKLVKMVDDKKISYNAAKGEVFEEMMLSNKDPEEIVEAKGLSQVSDQGEIENFCKTVIEANKNIVEDIKGGKEKAMGALVGLVMKESRGKANPKIVNDILRKLLL